MKVAIYDAMEKMAEAVATTAAEELFKRHPRAPVFLDADAASLLERAMVQR